MRRRDERTVAIALFLVLTLTIGSACWFVIFAVAWSSQIGTTLGTAAVAGVLPAFLTGAVGRYVLGPQVSRLLATGFSWPMCGWGIAALCAVPYEGWGNAFWTALGGVMFAAALAGTCLADWARRYFTAS